MRRPVADSIILSSPLAPFHLEERSQVGVDNRGRDFVRWRMFYVRKYDGTTVCTGTNETWLRHVLTALLERGGGVAEWTGAVSPAALVQEKRRGR